MKQGVLLLNFLFIGYFSIGLSAQKTETVFDRKVNFIDLARQVPMVPRLEETLGLCGRYEMVNGVNLWVETQGEGIPIVLVSGGPGTSHHYFHPHFQAVTSFSEVIFYDLRGVGLSDYSSGNSTYSIDQAVDDLEQLRQKLGHDRWVVLGLSFGGVIAQMYALKYPESLEGMVLLSSALPMSLDIGLGSRQYEFLSEEEKNKIASIYSIAGQRVAPVHTEFVSPELQRKMLYNAFSNGDWKRRHLKKWSQEEIAQYARYEFVHAKGYYQAMLGDYFEYDLKDLFKTFPVPTLIIEGKWDLAYSAEKANIMFEQFPNAQQEYWDNSGHIVFEDEPKRFYQTLQKFLTNLKPVPKKDLKNWKGKTLEVFYRKPNELQRSFLRRN